MYFLNSVALHNFDGADQAAARFICGVVDVICAEYARLAIAELKFELSYKT